jgi:hypothetical protein
MLVDPVVIDITYNLTISPNYAIFLENDTINITVNVASGVLTQLDTRGMLLIMEYVLYTFLQRVRTTQ